MCANDYVLHACSAPSNLKGQFCVDTMLVTTSGVAESTATAGGNSKNLRDGGEDKRWTRQSSNIQYLTFVSLLLTNVVLLTGKSLITRASSQQSRSTRVYRTREPSSKWKTTRYQIYFDFCKLVLWVNYELCECNMNFVTCMHRSWIFIWMDVIYVFILYTHFYWFDFCMCFKFKLQMK